MSDFGEPVKDDQTDDIESIEDELVEHDELDQFPVEDLADLGGADLEAAYLKAMSAIEASDLELPESVSPPLREDPESVAARALAAGVQNSPSPRETEIPSELSAATQSAPVIATSSNAAPVETPMTPRQIIEACLFVGGAPLTSKKLSSVLRGEFDTDYVDREIDELNRQYAAESRPYEIRLGEGGYRLALREEFERIRYKVYGLGPKEVRLSQEALEVLAVVAYHQPITQARVEELGKHGCGTVLRQLVRRELLAVERDPEQPRNVSYKTTPRFLSLFGIRNLDELPRHEQVSYK